MFRSFPTYLSGQVLGYERPQNLRKSLARSNPLTCRKPIPGTGHPGTFSHFFTNRCNLHIHECANISSRLIRFGCLEHCWNNFAARNPMHPCGTPRWSSLGARKLGWPKHPWRSQANFEQEDTNDVGTLKALEPWEQLGPRLSTLPVLAQKSTITWHDVSCFDFW